jgi:hypothetical protein
MSAPERVGLVSGAVTAGVDVWEWGEWWPDGDIPETDSEVVEYIRADVVERMVAEAREEHPPAIRKALSEYFAAPYTEV